MSATPSFKSDHDSSTQEVEPSTSEPLPDGRSLLKDAMDNKVGDLVDFLLLKFRMKEPTTKAEMLSSVIKNDQERFPAILSQACECLQLVFSLDVEEAEPSGDSYVLSNTLGLTLNGMLSPKQNVPKTGLLVNILGMIFMDGNCTPEEDVWRVLGAVGVYAGMEHFIYGEPRKLLTKVRVQERYLEYRQVPGSDPACYEFLWGPRTHAETSKVKVLEFLAKINDTVPSALTIWYEEALREEKEKSGTGEGSRAGEGAEAGSHAEAGGGARARACVSTTASTFSGPRGCLRPKFPSVLEESNLYSKRRGSSVPPGAPHLHDLQIFSPFCYFNCSHYTRVNRL